VAAPTLLAMRNNVRIHVQDTDTSVSTYWTDAQLNTFINTALRWWYENNEKRIKAVTAIATVTASAFEQDGDATFLYPEIFGVHLDASGISGVKPLKRLGWNEIKLRQTRDATTGEPEYYAALKYGAAAVSASAQNKWQFALWRVPTTGYSLTAIVRDYPVALSADADIVDLGDFEANCVEIIASLFALPGEGRPELMESLRVMLPQMIQDKLQTHEDRHEVRA